MQLLLSWIVKRAGKGLFILFYIVFLVCGQILKHSVEEYTKRGEIKGGKNVIILAAGILSSYQVKFYNLNVFLM